MLKKIKLPWLAVLLLFMPANVSLGADYSPENVKAGYLLNIQKYVTFGDPPRKVQKICYYEKDGISLAESVGGQVEKYASTHPEAQLRVKRFDAIRDMSSCDILYIPDEAEGDIDNIFAALGNAGTLTVSDAPRFITRGGMIGFVTDEDGRVKMQANLKKIKQKNTNIDIDTQLLEIMQIVVQ